MPDGTSRCRITCYALWPFDSCLCALPQHSAPALGLAFGQYWQREGMWLLPFRGRAFSIGGGSWRWPDPDVAPILPSTHSFPMVFQGAPMPRTWGPCNCLVPSSEEGGREVRERTMESVTAPFYLFCVWVPPPPTPPKTSFEENSGH